VPDRVKVLLRKCLPRAMPTWQEAHRLVAPCAD